MHLVLNNYLPSKAVIFTVYLATRTPKIMDLRIKQLKMLEFSNLLNVLLCTTIQHNFKSAPKKLIIIIIIIGVVWTQDVVLCAQIVKLET